MKVSKKIINLETESAFAILAKATKLKSEGKDVINLGIGQPDFSTPKNIQEAGIKAIKDGIDCKPNANSQINGISLINTSPLLFVSLSPCN